ncbi:MAG: hypothetical protein D6791_01700 [Chloroflexi bacterium]|nr:MAG: hypothetical protein D6791_01700 [Chloroflexota bacterium]
MRLPRFVILALGLLLAVVMGMVTLRSPLSPLMPTPRTTHAAFTAEQPAAGQSSHGTASEDVTPARQIVDPGTTRESVAGALRAGGLTGDVNFDCLIDLTDVMLVAGAWRARPGDLAYNSAYDLNGDLVIDIRDIALDAKRMGGMCSPVGVQMFEEWGDPLIVDRAVSAGVRWVRLYVHWGWVEPQNTTPENFDWTGVDRMVLAIQAAGLVPIFTVQGPPPWAAAVACGPVDVEDLGEFAEFMKSLVERYDGDGVGDMPGLTTAVKYYELYNEPDYDQVDGAPGGCWGGTDVNGNGLNDQVEYANLLKAAYPAVKAADPGSRLVFGSVAHEIFVGGHFNIDFVDLVLNALAQDPAAAANNYYFDILGFHQFDAFRDTWDGTLPYDQGILGKITHLRELLNSHGLSKPLLSTEIGLQVTGPPDLLPEVKEEAQARHLVHAYVRGLVGGLEVIIWYTVIDRPNELQYGLFDNLGNPRPAYTALQVLSQQLVAPTGEPATYEGQLSPTQTGSKFVQGYRFRMPDGTRKLVLWTDTGTKIKAQADTPATMCIDRNDLGVTAGEWTGRLRVTDQYGNETIVGRAGDPCVIYTIQQAAIYVEVAP